MLSTLDIVLALSFLVGVALAGNLIWTSTKPEDYFLGGRNLPWTAILASIVATETSTLTFIGAPAIAFAGNVGFIQLAAGYVIGRLVVAYLILPGYFRGSCRTTYEVLSTSLGEGTRRLASAIFLVTRTLADGVRLYASALVVSVVLGLDIIPSVVIIAGVTLLYTLRGGLVAVVWTDLIQLIVYLGGAVFAMYVLLTAVPGGITEIYQAAAASGKLDIFDFDIFSSNPYTLAAGLIGGAFLSMASHGTDHLIVQRLMASRNLHAARKALISSGVFVFLQFVLFLTIGMALFVFYRDYAATTFAGKPDEVFPFFILHEVPSGARGLIIAAVLASAVSTLSSSLNSLASSTCGDFIKPALAARWGKARMQLWENRWELLTGRTLAVVWCCVLLFVSFLAENWGSVLETGLAIASFTYGSLLGAFLLSILAKTGKERGRGVSAGMLTGIAVMTVLFFLTRLPWTWYVVVGTAVTCATGWVVMSAITLSSQRR